MPPTRTIAIRSQRADDVGGDRQPAAMTASLTRRRAMQLMAASLALASGACTRSPRQRIYPYVDMPEAGTAGMPIYYASAFVRGGHAHGVLVGTREGRPIKVEGNPLHPSSLGATDVFAQASVLELWDPDRAQSVRQRLETAHRLAAHRRAAATSTWAAFEAAWHERERELLRDRGARLRVLTEHLHVAQPARAARPAAPALPRPALASPRSARAARRTRGRPARIRPADADAVASRSRPLRSRLRRRPVQPRPRQRARRARLGRRNARPSAAPAPPGRWRSRRHRACSARAPTSAWPCRRRRSRRCLPASRRSSTATCPRPLAATAALGERRALRARRRRAAEAHGADSLRDRRRRACRRKATRSCTSLNQRLGAFGRTLDAIAPLGGGDTSRLPGRADRSDRRRRRRHACWSSAAIRPTTRPATSRSPPRSPACRSAST